MKKLSTAMKQKIEILFVVFVFLFTPSWVANSQCCLNDSLTLEEREKKMDNKLKLIEKKTAIKKDTTFKLPFKKAKRKN